MKKLLICCLFGNTANALAKKMQKAANEHGYQMLISAVGLDNFASVAPAFDCFLVAPHVQYKLDELKQEIGEARPIAIIESYPFASLDGEKVLQTALKQMPELLSEMKSKTD
ncbi:PTS sugar transporter subunit IIB [Dryocola sp. BD586]|uniref:PTS sugar transporter subunit IIB n=1 Tax=Dryocola sp. BD586 TaxID=3133271 RepID=UPI003F4F4C4A